MEYWDPCESISMISRAEGSATGVSFGDGTGDSVLIWVSAGVSGPWESMPPANPALDKASAKAERFGGGVEGAGSTAARLLPRE